MPRSNEKLIPLQTHRPLKLVVGIAEVVPEIALQAFGKMSKSMSTSPIRINRSISEWYCGVMCHPSSPPRLSRGNQSRTSRLWPEKEHRQRLVKSDRAPKMYEGKATGSYRVFLTPHPNRCSHRSEGLRNTGDEGGRSARNFVSMTSGSLMPRNRTLRFESSH